MRDGEITLGGALFAVLIWLAVFAAACWIGGCATRTLPPPLPHRQPAELFPQADSPPADCPGQHSYTVDVPDGSGTFFLYCFGKRVEL